MWRGLLVLGLTVVGCDSSSSSPDAPELDAQVGTPVTDGAAEVDAGLPGTDAQLDASGSEGDAGTPSDGGDAARPTDAAPFVCDVQAPTACPDPAPRYADVAPVIEERCESCHSPRWTGPWPLDTYQHVADWQSEVRSHLLACTMPPVESGLTMPNEERLLVLTWLRCGLPR